MLAVARAENAVSAIARVLCDELGVQSCAVYARDDMGGSIRLLARASTLPPVAAQAAQPAGVMEASHIEREVLRPAIEQGVVVFQRLDGTSHLRPPGEDPGTSLLNASDARTVQIPLRVRGHIVGVLSLDAADGIRVSDDAARLAAPLAYYAALAVERARLTADAEQAEALRQAGELKDALLASVSHDLRTPLTTIKALASEIRREGDERAATIETEADRLNRTVADLLDLSRARAGALPVRVESNTADDLVGAALQQLSGIAGVERIHAQLQNAGEILVGQFDFVLALRALVNLLENALKYSPADAGVELHVRHVPPYLQFDVGDRGPGVPPAEAERIFDPFYRAASPAIVTAATGSHGAGLGLAIARSLAEAQGGRVIYEPRAGGGSCFSLLLPDKS
jgi:two-component system sensor histidine kinase KdpD